MKDNCRTVSELEDKVSSQMGTLKTEVDDLYKTVYKGNGKPSLVTQVTGIDGKLKGLKESVDDKLESISRESSLKFDSLHQKLENKFGKYEGYVDGKFHSLEALIKMSHTQNQTDRTGWWGMKAAMFTTIVTVIAVAVSAIFNYIVSL
tara:strand:- start:30 stop:473 length:444 start_codon:yes stop_codon:yes gene_type:complete